MMDNAKHGFDVIIVGGPRADNDHVVSVLSVVHHPSSALRPQHATPVVEARPGRPALAPAARETEPFRLRHPAAAGPPASRAPTGPPPSRRACSPVADAAARPPPGSIPAKRVPRLRRRH